MRILPSIVLPDPGGARQSLARTVVEFGQRRIGVLSQSSAGTYLSLYNCEDGRRPLHQTFRQDGEWRIGAGGSSYSQTVRHSAFLRNGRAVIAFGDTSAYYSETNRAGLQVLDVVDGQIVPRPRHMQDVTLIGGMFIYATGPNTFAQIRSNASYPILEGRHYEVSASGEIRPRGSWVRITGGPWGLSRGSGKCRLLVRDGKVYILGPRIWRMDAMTFQVEASTGWLVRSDGYDDNWFPELDPYWGSPMWGPEGTIHFFRAKDPDVMGGEVLRGTVDPETLSVDIHGEYTGGIRADHIPAEFPRAELSFFNGLGGTDFDALTGDMRGSHGAALLRTGYWKQSAPDVTTAAVGLFGTTGRAVGPSPLGVPIGDGNIFGASHMTYYTRDGYVLGHHRNRQMVAVASLVPAPRSDLRAGDHVTQGYFS